MLAGIASADVPALPNAAPVPSMQDLQTLYQQSAWQPLIAGASRALLLKDDAAASYDRTKLARMKSEAHVHLAQFGPAMETLTTAAREKQIAPADADRFRAWAMLFQTSDALGYKPPATAVEPHPATYEVIDPAKRDQALAALWSVRLTELSQRCDAINGRSNFTLSIELARDVVKNGALERTVTGVETHTDALLDTIQRKAIDRITNYIAAGDGTVKSIATTANQVVVLHSVTQRRGPDAGQRQQLLLMNTGCEHWVTYIRLLIDAVGTHVDPQLPAQTTAMQQFNTRVNAVEFDDYHKVPPALPAR